MQLPLKRVFKSVGWSLNHEIALFIPLGARRALGLRQLLSQHVA
jgi:hypothetical protein